MHGFFCSAYKGAPAALLPTRRRVNCRTRNRTHRCAIGQRRRHPAREPTPEPERPAARSVVVTRRSGLHCTNESCTCAAIVYPVLVRCQCKPALGPTSVRRSVDMTFNASTSRECLFTFYPGNSTGYSGFTDHHAMRCDLNDWLLKETDDMQYWLAGFGAGFIQAAHAVCNDKSDGDSIRSLVVHTEETRIIRSVDWLQRLQLSGVDNGSPSTANLLHALDGICQKLETDGPIRHEYWSNHNASLSHRLDGQALRVEKIHAARQHGLDIDLRLR